MHFLTKIESLDTREIAHSEIINWEHFKNSTILVTGATGLIGKQIVNSILYTNENSDYNIKIVALVRNKKKADELFWKNYTNNLKYIVQDIQKPIKFKDKIDYIIHTANSTSSKDFTEKPVETINSIINGTKNILEFARVKKVKGMVYLSSMEVYGKTDFDRNEPLKEEDLGYIDLTNPRSSYPEGKRLAESLCSSYFREYNVPVKIARLSQVVGAAVEYNDNRVWAQFARSVVEKQDIVLHTKGESIRSLCYITDAVQAILTLLERGNAGECYNVANMDTTSSIKENAEMLCAKYPDIHIRYELNDSIYPAPSKLYLDTSKITNDTGWKAAVNLEDIFDRLINCFSAEKTINKKHTNILLQKLFSITNANEIKTITILGMRFSYNFAEAKQKYLKRYQKIFGIKRNKIVFSNYQGNNYGCNSKYVCEELLKRKSKYDIVWLVEKNIPKTSFPKGVRIVKYHSKKAFEELATAKVWVENYHKNQFIRKGLIKSDKQKYIQMWHGSLGIKKIEKSVEKLTENPRWMNNAITNSHMTDFWISNSDFETNVYKESFWDVENIKLFGHPRNDVFFKDTKAIEEKVHKTYNTNKKIILYVPSFTEYETLVSYDIDVERVKSALAEKFSGEWEFMVRLHPRVAKFSKSVFPNADIIDATSYPDIQELLVAADVVITDYSSCIFDFMLSRKPAFIYASNLEKYNIERGFYYPLSTTPFPIAENNEELVNNIKNFDIQNYQTRTEEFLKEKGCMEDGHAAERVVDLIEEIVNNG